jgi:hypothetical protein
LVGCRSVPVDDKASAQHWGIFAGLWAPTLMAIGNALEAEERWATAYTIGR